MQQQIDLLTEEVETLRREMEEVQYERSKGSSSLPGNHHKIMMNNNNQNVGHINKENPASSLSYPSNTPYQTT